MRFSQHDTKPPMHAYAHRCDTVPRARRHNRTISIRVHLRLSVVPFFVFILVPFIAFYAFIRGDQ